MTDCTSLISRLKKAEGPDRELDCDIARSLGWQVQWTTDDAHQFIPCGIWGDERKGEKGLIPRFTESLDAARGMSNWVVLYASDIGADGLALVQLGDPSRSPTVEVSGIHPSLVVAWCIAALKARQSEKKEGGR